MVEWKTYTENGFALSETLFTNITPNRRERSINPASFDELTRNQLSSLDGGTCAKFGWTVRSTVHAPVAWYCKHRNLTLPNKITMRRCVVFKSHFLPWQSVHLLCHCHLDIVQRSRDYPLLFGRRLKRRRLDCLSSTVQRCSNLVRQRSSAVAFSIDIGHDPDWIYWSMLDEDRSTTKHVDVRIWSNCIPMFH